MTPKRFILSLIGIAFLAAAPTACSNEEGGPSGGGGGGSVPDNVPSGSGSGSNSSNPQVLVGHWRTTTIVFESPQDENWVLHSDGTWEDWLVTASGRSDTTTGTWRVENTTLFVRLDGDQEESATPFTFFEGQLVYPNIPNRRLFWERL